jgi:hypothetical protein
MSLCVWQIFLNHHHHIIIVSSHTIIILELLLFFCCCWFHCLVSEERKKDIVANLNGVNVEQTLLRRYKGKIDGVGTKMTIYKTRIDKKKSIV